jgi:hypothetical protein
VANSCLFNIFATPNTVALVDYTLTPGGTDPAWVPVNATVQLEIGSEE